MPPHELGVLKSQHPSGKIFLGDWAVYAEPEAALLYELDRFDLRERVPDHRRPVRARAKAIIEGRQAWPLALAPWKLWRELRFYHCGRGTLPPWEDVRNLTRPQRERVRSEDQLWDRKAARRRRIAEMVA